MANKSNLKPATQLQKNIGKVINAYRSRKEFDKRMKGAKTTEEKVRVIRQHGKGKHN